MLGDGSAVVAVQNIRFPNNKQILSYKAIVDCFDILSKTIE